MAASTTRARLLFAGFHPLILQDSRIHAGTVLPLESVSAEEATLLPAVDRRRPDVLLIDLLHTSSLKTIQRVTAISPACRVVALTGLRHTDVTESIFSAGATGILSRSHALEELFLAVSTVLSGQRYLSPALIANPASILGRGIRQPHNISASDERILHLLAQDYPAPRIARALGLSVETIRLSIACLKQHFGRRTDRGLKRFAISHEPATDCS